MANIHTLKDLQSKQSSSSSFGPNLVSFNNSFSWRMIDSMQQAERGVGPFNERLKNIRFIDMLIPNFNIKSCIFIISCLQFVVYVATLVCGNEVKSRQPLTPSIGVLSYFGANISTKVQHGEVFRLLFAIFLHANIWHILFNVFFQIRLGLDTEKRYGATVFLIIYFISGIFASLVSDTFVLNSETVKVGASTAGFGLIGVMVSEIALEWHFLQYKERIILDLMISLLTMIIFSFGMPNIDQLGHLGGFISGVCFGILFNYKMENKPTWYNKARWVSFLSFIIITIFCSSVLWIFPFFKKSFNFLF